MSAIGCKNFERISQLLQRAAENLKVSARGTVPLQLVGSLLYFFDEFRVRLQIDNMFNDIGFGLIDMLGNARTAEDELSKIIGEKVEICW